MSSLPAHLKFVSGGAGRVFVMDYPSVSTPIGHILFVPPFAEESNRARRMVHLQARLWADIGFQVLVPDLYGAGDSAGKFEEGSWDLWRSDLAAVLAACHPGGHAPVIVWALRLGALLALDALSRREIEATQAVLWSPCILGKNFMTQFLRLRTMAGMISESESRESIADLRSKLAAGHSLEVAGYELTPEIVAAIDEMEIEELLARTELPIYWFEMVSDESRGMPPAAARIATSLQNQGRLVTTQAIEGPDFWSTPEISTAPRLLAAASKIFAMM